MLNITKQAEHESWHKNVNAQLISPEICFSSASCEIIMCFYKTRLPILEPQQSVNPFASPLAENSAIILMNLFSKNHQQFSPLGRFAAFPYSMTLFLYTVLDQTKINK